jgi:N-acetylglucosaminyldiphosphoundecaprenol N-acetyl-beta-D-mannosaminyltransferase
MPRKNHIIVPRTRPTNTVSILDIAFSRLQIPEILKIIGERIEQKKLTQLAFANAEYALNMAQSPLLGLYLSTADYILPDASSIVWASKQLKTAVTPPLTQRVTGTDFLYALLAWCAEHHKKIYLLGATPETLAQALQQARSSYPTLKIDGHDGFFDIDDTSRIIKKINMSKSDILMVCMGNPLQEEWLTIHRAQLKPPIRFGNGGALDFLAGTVIRAPMWMQRSGLEWLWRLTQDFTLVRVKRQLRLLLFVWLIWLEVAARNASTPTQKK